ncbi:unnamed protein product [Symbiodinium sp. CCMP2592]|nr:unnamed protein product [Symbiodinium sp. CCMP2592]
MPHKVPLEAFTIEAGKSERRCVVTTSTDGALRGWSAALGATACVAWVASSREQSRQSPLQARLQHALAPLAERFNEGHIDPRYQWLQEGTTWTNPSYDSYRHYVVSIHHGVAWKWYEAQQAQALDSGGCFPHVRQIQPDPAGLTRQVQLGSQEAAQFYLCAVSVVLQRFRIASVLARDTARAFGRRFANKDIISSYRQSKEEDDSGGANTSVVPQPKQKATSVRGFMSWLSGAVGVPEQTQALPPLTSYVGGEQPLAGRNSTGQAIAHEGLVSPYNSRKVASGPFRPREAEEKLNHIEVQSAAEGNPLDAQLQELLSRTVRACPVGLAVFGIW